MSKGQVYEAFFMPVAGRVRVLTPEKKRKESKCIRLGSHYPATNKGSFTQWSSFLMRNQICWEVSKWPSCLSRLARLLLEREASLREAALASASLLLSRSFQPMLGLWWAALEAGTDLSQQFPSPEGSSGI